MLKKNVKTRFRYTNQKNRRTNLLRADINELCMFTCEYKSLLLNLYMFLIGFRVLYMIL